MSVHLERYFVRRVGQIARLLDVAESVNIFLHRVDPDWWLIVLFFGKTHLCNVAFFLAKIAGGESVLAFRW